MPGSELFIHKINVLIDKHNTFFKRQKNTFYRTLAKFKKCQKFMAMQYVQFDKGPLK